MKQARVILTIAILVLINTTEATIISDDGWATTDNVIPEGSPGMWLESNDNISDSDLGSRLYAYHDSEMNILRSSIGEVADANDYSSMLSVGYAIENWSEAYRLNSLFNVFNTSTSIGSGFRARQNSRTTFGGGAAGGYISASNNSRLDVYGGLIRGRVRANGNSGVTIYGSGSGAISAPSVLLTGIPSNGDPINTSTVPVPEPGTVLLVGLGGLAIRRRRG